MNDALLDLPVWDALGTAGREDLAREIARRHPRFVFQGIRRHAQGGQEHDVAFFDWCGIEFALIPGAEVVLGYDSTRPWTPSPEEYGELESCWLEGHESSQTASAHRISRLEDHLREYLTPLRRVTIAPVLMEVSASQIGLRLLEPDDPDFDYPPAEGLIPGVGGCLRFLGDRTLDYQRGRDGTLQVQEEKRISHAEILAAMAADGFRPPTSDEWEYACGAGTRTLFRWGDHSPLESYRPRSPAFPDLDWRSGLPEIEQLVQTIHSMQDSPRDYEDPSTEPNAFGLIMTDGSNRTEVCLEPGVLRGGDDGCAACGGMDLFTSCWLHQATSFLNKWYGEANDYRYRAPRVRRVFPLTDSSGSTRG